MEQTYLAHIAEDGRTQTVQEHLQETARLAELFAGEFHAAEQGRLAGLSHDIGKCSQEFQKRIHGDSAHADHSTAGAFECALRGQPFAAFSVAGHHGGLPDGGSQTDRDGSFHGRLNKAARGGIPNYEGWQQEVTLPNLPPPEIADKLEAMFFIRMLYSCLVDADYLDTEAFMDGKGRKDNPADMDLLWARLQAYIAPWFPPKGELNAQRCAMLRRCIDEGLRREPGLFTLTVPTGGGKTVASLAFALAQAKAKGLRRVIYVIPYTSIIEQTADVFREILGAENVLEHHSGVLFDMEQEATPEQVRQAKATENWDMPVVVTTAVQFFESLYANRSSKCRKLHNLTNSVIIFDEAQMMPLAYLSPCVFAIAQLVKGYGVSAVLCTATQPALEPLFGRFIPHIPTVELCPPEVCRWEDFRRVTFRKVGKRSWDEIAAEMRELPQALCIVNSRKNAQALYEKLKGEGVFHLSTLMCPAHRREQLEHIRRRLKEGRVCRVISTSLIEAGVDVDFPAVFREEAGLDSILQAAGRCNREGKRTPEESVVTIFQSESAPPPLFHTAIGAGRQIMDHHEDVGSREAIHDYFRELLDLSGEAAKDRQRIMDTMQKELFPFRTVAERFHLIDNATRMVYIPLNGEAEGLIAQLEGGQLSRRLFRKLGQYGVNVYEQHFSGLQSMGALKLLADGSAVLADKTLYDETMGLTLKTDSGQGLFV